jgi:hypothetical protein
MRKLLVGIIRSLQYIRNVEKGMKTWTTMDGARTDCDFKRSIDMSMTMLDSTTKRGGRKHDSWFKDRKHP